MVARWSGKTSLSVWVCIPWASPCVCPPPPRVSPTLSLSLAFTPWTSRQAEERLRSLVVGPDYQNTQGCQSITFQFCSFYVKIQFISLGVYDRPPQPPWHPFRFNRSLSLRKYRRHMMPCFTERLMWRVTCIAWKGKHNNLVSSCHFHEVQICERCTVNGFSHLSCRSGQLLQSHRLPLQLRWMAMFF